MTARDPLADDLRELVHEAGHDRASHPSVDRLHLYLKRELAAEERDILRDHLTTCESCAQELLDLAAFSTAVHEGIERADAGVCPPGLPGEDRACGGEELERVWESLRDSLSEGSRGRAFVVGSLWSQLTLPSGGRRTPWMVALMTLLTTASLCLALSSHSQVMSSFTRLAPADPTVIEMQPWGVNVVERTIGLFRRPIRLTFEPKGRDFRGYSVHLIDRSRPENGLVWRYRGSRWGSDRALRLTLDRKKLPAGDYSILLYGWTGQDGEVVARYRLRLEELHQRGLDAEREK